MFIAGPLILLVALIGITYAFFNYTRTGASNTIKVGKIVFNSKQNGVINLTNVFPIDKNNANSENTRITYAKVDGGASNPGYFTLKAN